MSYFPESVQSKSMIEENEKLHESLSLLLTGDRIRIPNTQSHPPMTEDMQVNH